MDTLIFASLVVVVLFVTLIWLASRYKRCPSDKVLVVYGKVSSATGSGLAARCYHGGGAFVWPVVQDFSFLDLTPMSIEINLTGALSQQNIRVNVPSTFTVGIHTEPGVMENAAERLLGMRNAAIMELAKDLIFGQMRVVIATMPIEEINADRDKLVANISTGVEVELKKVGLRLINVNIQDITDESGYIEALGKEAAARAINDAKIKVSQKDRDGDIGKAEADQQKRIKVAAANADAVQGENEAAVQIANSNASRKTREAEAMRLATAAEMVKHADALREAYAAEEQAERQRAKREEAAQVASTLVSADIEKRKIEILAEAEAERIRRLKKGEADGIRLVLEAQAEGQKAILEKKAEAMLTLVQAAGGDPRLAAQLLVTDQLPKLIDAQAKAISGIKIDKVTVWDGGRGTGPDGKGSTAGFLANLIGALPPLHEVARQAGLELPGFLGNPVAANSQQPASGDAAATAYADRFLRTWRAAVQQLDALTAYDTNGDGKLTPSDLATVTGKALRWADASADQTAQWSFASGSESVVVTGWDQLAMRVAGNPARSISLVGDAGSLPFGVVAAGRSPAAA